MYQEFPLMKNVLFCFLLMMVSALSAPAQNLNRREFPEMERPDVCRILQIPDLEGFITLKGDFHTHTVFSDGSVWPDNRIDEAWRDGLDVIAITDHDRYHPHQDHVKTDNNAPFAIAKDQAAKKNILLIRATEITRRMPPGHFNALFVTDANLESLKDTSRQALLASVGTFVEQGAVIVWNHPGWAAQQKDTVKWFEIHQTLLDKGWLHGIEVFNYIEWYPIALEWAMKKGLTPFANSDIHDPIVVAYGDNPEFIRPMTLVFAKERSVPAIKEAILAKRTVAWFNGHLAGSAALLEQLFKKSVSVEKLYSASGKTRYQLTNSTDLGFKIRGLSKEWAKEQEIPARTQVIITIADEVKMLRIEVTNLHTGMRENLVTEVELKKMSD